MNPLFNSQSFLQNRKKLDSSIILANKSWDPTSENKLLKEIFHFSVQVDTLIFSWTIVIFFYKIIQLFILEIRL